jgi:hypothetical protein
LGPLGCKLLWYQFTLCGQANSIPHALTLGDYDGEEVIIDGRNRLKAARAMATTTDFRSRLTIGRVIVEQVQGGVDLLQ